jgi:hypothetical protein
MSEITPTDSPAPPENKRTLWLLSLIIVIVGIGLRVYPSAGFTGTGFDEALYRDNVLKLDKAGIFNYPAICQLYVEDQRKPESITKLPPTRFLYIYTSWLWKRAEFGDAPPVAPKTPRFPERDPSLASLHRVAILFSCLGLIVSGLAAWRILGVRALPGTLALMAFSPLQIHLGQHALIDGVFTFWAVLCLWLLWENLLKPNDTRLLAAFGASLALMVVTKENSFFVYLALCGLIAVNRWAKFGTVTPKLVLISIAGPLLGVLILVLLAGGVPQFVEIYSLLVSKAENLTYAIKTGDGPWYRYLVDLLLLSPLVFLLAVGGVFTQVRGSRAFVYLVAFVGFSYLIMCNVKYGMNLRYASIWDLPIRALAAAQVVAIARRFGQRQALAASIAIAALCAYDLRQYQIFFIDGRLYELVTGGLLQVVKILK